MAPGSEPASSSADPWRPIIDLTAVGGMAAAISVSGVGDGFLVPLGAIGALLAAYVIIMLKRPWGAVLVVVPLVAVACASVAILIGQVAMVEFEHRGPHGGELGRIRYPSMFLAGAVAAVVLGGSTIAVAVKKRVGLMRYLALCAAWGGVLAVAGYWLCWTIAAQRMVNQREGSPSLQALVLVWPTTLMGSLLGWGVSKLGR